jgi:hypothetical protein
VTLPTKLEVLGSNPGSGIYLCDENEYLFLSHGCFLCIKVFISLYMYDYHRLVPIVQALLILGLDRFVYDFPLIFIFLFICSYNKVQDSAMSFPIDFKLSIF